MTRILFLAVLGTLLSGALLAQPEGSGAAAASEWASLLEKHDADYNGKITLVEVRKTAKVESKDDSEIDALDNYRYYLVELLSADFNDNKEINKSEFDVAYARTEKGEKLPLTSADWQLILSEYLNPYLELTYREYDKDGDREISKAETELIEDFDESMFAVLDADKNGKVDSDEFRKAYKDYLGESFEMTDAAADAPAPEITPELTASSREIFDGWDANKDGFTTRTELKNATNSEAIANWWGLYLAFLVMDANDDIQLTFDEYLFAQASKVEGAKGKIFPSDMREAEREIWSTLDGDHDGNVIEIEYKAVFPDTDEFAEADTDKNGVMSPAEFWALIEDDLEDSFVYIQADDANAAPDPDDDPSRYTLYRRKGRSWKLKSMSGDVVVYLKSEVIEVGRGYARVQTSVLGADGKLYKGLAPTVEKVVFTKIELPPGNYESVQKTIKVEGGEFECTGYRRGDNEVSVWTSSKYPNLIVKTDTLELVEFNE